VLELLYGLVLFAAMSGSKHHRHQKLLVAPENYGEVALKSGSGAAPKEKEATPPKEKEATPPSRTDQPPQAPSPPTEAPKEDVPKAETQPAQPAPPPEPPTAPEPPKLAEVRKPDISPKPEEKKQEERLLGPLHILVDPDQDCAAIKDAGGLTLTVPGKLHLISPELNTWNAPRVLTEVGGDFSAQVTVAGDVRPGITPLKLPDGKGTFPITFQSAGLLLWVDESSFVRLERAETFAGAVLHHVRLEYTAQGQGRQPVELKVREGPLMLRLVRGGNELSCWYSSDGGTTWVPVKRWTAGLPARVLIGVSASNLSPKPLEARFEDFSLLKNGRARRG